jgi:RNA polymerase sigma-70 factor (ECF subfamily)
MSQEGLKSAFLARVPAGARAALDGPALERTLQELVAAARRAWPSVRLPPERFAAYLAERLPAQVDRARLSTLHAADLYLACACLEGDRAALAELERGALQGAAAAAARVDRSPAFADEVKQVLRQRLLSPEDGRPRLLEYEGRAPLRSWVRAAAVRTALNLTRGKRAGAASEDGDAPLQSLTAGGLDPELDYVQRKYRPHFVACFKEAMAALDSRERTVLRLHLVEGAGLEGIARYYRVHRTTVTRWMATARAQLVANTRRLLTERLRLTGTEVESLVRSLGSRLDFSISQVLTSGVKTPPP